MRLKWYRFDFVDFDDLNRCFEHARTMIKMEEIKDGMRLLEFNDRFSRLENEGLLPPCYIQISPVFHHRFFIFLYIPHRNNYTLYNNNNSV